MQTTTPTPQGVTVRAAQLARPGLGCWPFRIDGALHFFFGTFGSAKALAIEAAVALGAAVVEVLS